MNLNTMNINYVQEYETFSDSFKKTEVSGEDVGIIVMRMAGHFMHHNMALVQALRAHTAVMASIQGQVDGVTGKPISSAKAEILAAATPEAAAYEEAKMHVQNLEQIVNALKSLQKGVLLEYSHAQ